MQSYYDEDAHYRYSYTEGKYFVLNPKWSKSSRIDFFKVMKDEIEVWKTISYIPSVRKQIQINYLREIPLLIPKSPHAEPAPLNPLDQLALDPHVILDDRNLAPRASRNSEIIDPRIQSRRDIRFDGEIAAPGYSPDGRFGCVVMRRIVGLHPEIDTHILELVDGAWVLIYANTEFHL